MLQLIVVAILLWFSESGAVLQPQGRDGWITIDEETQPSIKCTGFDANDTVTWSILQHQQSSTVIGSCVPSQTTCNSSHPNIKLSRPSRFYSNLTITSGHRELSGKTVACSQGTTTAATIATSRIRVIRRGVITGCETTEDYSRSWTLPVNCTIEGAFSSDNRYTCSWYLSTMGSRINSTTTPLIKHPEVPGQQYISGHCIITWQLPTADGDYTYQLEFFPGPLLPHTVKHVTIRTGKDDSVVSQFPLAVVAGGAGAAVVLVIITVIVVKRRKGTKSESTETERNHIPVNSDDEFEEHINIVYQSSDGVVPTTQPQTGASKPPTTPLRVSPFTKPTDKDEQETSFGYVTLNGEKPTETGSAPVNRRVQISQYTDVADAYSTVDDDGLTFFAASSGWKYIPQSTAGLSSDYAVVDAYSSVDDGREDFLAGQARCQTDMASDYADADGYSSVKESGPRMETPPQKASGTQDDYAVVNNADKAAKGSAQPDDDAQGTTPGPVDGDEYNSLNYGDHQQTSKNIDEQYSHIGAPS